MTVASAIERGGTDDTRRRMVALAAVLAAAPDLDVLVSIALRPLAAIPHRGATHTIAFALLGGALAAIAGRGLLGSTRLRASVAVAAVLLSHPLLDYLMGCGPAVPLFWPISDRGFLFPFRVVPTAYYSMSPMGLLAVIVSPATWVGVLLETAIFLPLFLLSRRRTGPPHPALVAVLTLGLLLTLLIYNR